MLPKDFLGLRCSLSLQVALEKLSVWPGMEGSSVFGPGDGGVESSTMEAQVASGEVVDGFTHAGTNVVSQLRSGQVLHQLPEHERTTLEEQERNSDEEDVRLQIEDDDSRSPLLVMSLPYIQAR